MATHKGLTGGAFCALVLSLGSLASAQDNVGDESTVRYPASYFEEWAPVTAQDMMDRIPGLNSGGGRGGFGGGGRHITKLSRANTD